MNAPDHPPTDPLLPDLQPSNALAPSTINQMAQLVFTPSGKRGLFPVGTPVLTAARRLGVDLDSLCGGRGICGRCQITPSFGDFPKHNIKSLNDNLTEFNDVEAFYKSKKSMKDTRRLGCQCRAMGDLVIDVPKESQVHRQIIRKGAEERTIRIDPVITLHYITVEQPDMHIPAGDLERLNQALQIQWGIRDVRCPLSLLRQLQTTLRTGEWKVTVALHNRNEIVAIWPGLQEDIYGLAIDIGSTTMSAHLTHLRSGKVVNSSGAMNPQIRFGEDLMSRVSYVMMNENGAEELTRIVQEHLSDLIHEAAEQSDVPFDQIMELVLVGNPIMHHLMLGVDPRELGWAPFALATNQPVMIWASEIGLNGYTNPGARAYFLPCVAGHVGADTASVILSESPNSRSDISLIIDVGTNAEIVLGNKDRLLACSSPTGPALEGAQISCGQRAASGAIERIRIDADTLEPRYSVIGSDLWSDQADFDKVAQEHGVTGICGSGIIEIIAEMFLAGILTHDGVINGALAARTPRIQKDGRTYKYVVLPANDDHNEISILQADIRAIQLAKAALYAGTQLLIDKLGQYPDRIVLAGAFGSHISPLYALVLGLIPDCALENIHPVGNAAGTGARIALLDRKARARLTKTIRNIEKIETAIEPAFQQHFVEAMAFPHKTAKSEFLSQYVALPDPALEPKMNEAEGGRRASRRRKP
ncbi:MAG: ASKHA domain-containing protein [Alphaproteobacteria bacterium]